MPILYIIDTFFADKAPKMRPPSGDGIFEMFEAFMGNFPEHLRGPIIAIAPAFLAGRFLAGFIMWLFPKKELTPEEERAKKKKLLKFYNMENMQ